MESGFSIPRGYTLLSKKELKEITDKADAWDNWMESGKQTLDMLANNIESVRKYLNELEDTGGFIDKQKIMKLLEAEG